MLEITDVSKSFNRKLALDSISLKVNKGEIYGLLGPNGAGKTTLIRIINQIVLADKGLLRYDGKLMNEEHLRHIGYLPEERGLYKTMEVLEHLIFLARLRGMYKESALKNANFWLEKFEIKDWSKKKIEELSKGMAQKVQFIAAIVHEPELLILDEPLSGFDPLNVELILKELKELKAQGKTIILSTHNMRSVEEICDRAALIHKSQKLAEDSVWNLREAQKNDEYIVRFTGNMIGFANALWTDFELIDKQELGENRFQTVVKMRGQNKIDDLLKALMGQIKIEAVEERIPTMQEVFMNLINRKEAENA
ncbi:MAG: ATP-binding cassette domain-containing protein [Flavobacteriales bacterium]|nr:ATP-binding cassette domain-containing protein [Crocinitomicaceae bacterium]NBX79332.1 ATP-binding cassette domain-containing protein [Flavobacteriales bacterium]NCA20252.1 ATP-binding cassette domain-containing protein [Crocinitomicaceae bacterium]